MSGPLVLSLVAHYDGVFVGPNGDYASVLEALAGVSAGQALWKPSPGANSIWQIVDHLTASAQWQIDMLEKGEATSPPWSEPSGDEAAWQDAVARLKETHGRARTAMERLTDERLLTVDPKWNRTLLELVQSSGPAHDAHHSGQIDYIKGLEAL